MPAALKNMNAWLAFVVMLIAVRWIEKSVPAIGKITNPAMNG